MIITSHSRKDLGGIHRLLSYMFEKESALRDAKGNTFVFTQHLHERSLRGWYHEYQMNEQFRKDKRKGSVYCFHEILSLHDLDRYEGDVEVLRVLTQEYIRHRAPDALVVAVPHFDQDHPHVHLCISGIGYRSGLRTSISKAQFRSVKQVVQRFQETRFPHIRYSSPIHGRGRGSHQRTFPGLQELRKRISELWESSPSASEFITRLKSHGYVPYRRGRQFAGILVAGKKYRWKRLGLDQCRSVDIPSLGGSV